MLNSVKEKSADKENGPYYGLAIAGDDLWFYHHVISMMGGKYYEREGNNYRAIISEDPNTLNALSLINALYNDRILYVYDHNKAEKYLKEGLYNENPWGMRRAAIISTDCRSYVTPRGTKMNIFSMRDPTEENIKARSISYYGFGIYRNSSNEETAWEVIKYMVSDYFQNEYYKKYGMKFPTTINVKSIIEEPREYERELLEESLQETIDNARNLNVIDYYEFNILKEVGQAMQKVFYEGEDLFVALKQADDAANENAFK